MRLRSAAIGFIALSCVVPVAHAASLVNINTADLATLETLPHIGAVTAQRIIDYRTAHGPFATIEDIQKVSGIKSGIFSDIKAYITVGGSGSFESTTPPDVASGSSGTSTTPENVVLHASPQHLSVNISAGDEIVFQEVPMTLKAEVASQDGVVDTHATVYWSFGDGSSAEGRSVEKTYHYAGTYRVVATAREGEDTGRAEATVTVRPAAVRIASISSDGIVLSNESDIELDLSRWRLTSSKGIFILPLGTALLPGAAVLFPFTVTDLPVAYDARLSYPDGILAAQYVPESQSSTSMQPTVRLRGSHKVTPVEPITSTSVPTHAQEPVIAPAAATDTAAAGAPSLDPAAAAASPAAGLFSPWTLGLLGVIALAGGAFVLL